MNPKARQNSLLLFLAMLVPALAWSQAQTTNLELNGRSGQVSVLRSGGRTYADIVGLAQIANGSLSFQPNLIVLTFPGAAAAPPPVPAPAAAAAAPADPNVLSRGFMKAGIEDLALMREWASPLGYAIQNGYPITDSWVNQYRDQAAQGLRLAEVAAQTDGDRNALQLLTNGFNLVKQWSDRLVDARKNMDTANYTMSANALRQDPLSQKIINCGHFLSAMLGSGTFADDSSCH